MNNFDTSLFLKFLIPTCLTFVGVIIALISYRKNNIKKLSYRIVARSQLLKNIPYKVTNKIRFTIDDVEYNNVDFVEICIFNNGHKSIDKTDFNSDLNIKLDDNCKILNVVVSEQSPVDLNLVLDHDKNIILIKPLLLNKEDYFILQILATNFLELNVNGRIKEISKIKEVNTVNIKLSIFQNIIATFLLVALICIISSLILKTFNVITYETYNWIILRSFVIFVVLVFIVQFIPDKSIISKK